MSVTIYHNPRCTKSRQTLSLLEEKGVELDIVEYLNSPPDLATLKTLIRMLGIQPQDLLRKHETTYKEAGLDKENISDDQILQAMIDYPILIERPIVINNDKAAIGRPPENILKILD